MHLVGSLYNIVEPYCHSVITVPVCWLGECLWPAAIQPCLLIHWHSNIQLPSCTILRIHLAKISTPIIVVFLPLRRRLNPLRIYVCLCLELTYYNSVSAIFCFICGFEENNMSFLWSISGKRHLFLWWIYGDTGYILLPLWTFMACSWWTLPFIIKLRTGANISNEYFSISSHVVTLCSRTSK